MKYNPFDIYVDEYEEWFKKNQTIFQSELLALKQVIPMGKKGVEIGIGSGIFAEKLGINFGIDPSEKMLCHAKLRNLTVVKGVAENLPYPDNSFDFAAFITSLCFIDDPNKALQESYRIIKKKGDVVIAFIDKESSLGKSLDIGKKDSKFYKSARFYSVKEMYYLIETNGFAITKTIQTLINMNAAAPEIPLKGYGKGSFVVIKGRKK